MAFEMSSKGKRFIADFVARDPKGNWFAIEVKTNSGTISPNQQAGYPELSTTGATLNTSRLSSYGMNNGDSVVFPIEFDLWKCPSCT
jgi:hypothetical protein